MWTSAPPPRYSRYNAAHQQANPNDTSSLNDIHINVTDESWICVILQALHICVNEISSPTYTTLMYVMYRIIYSFSSDFVSNLKMAIRAKTCSSDIYISDNIVVFKTVYLSTIFYIWLYNVGTPLLLICQPVSKPWVMWECCGSPCSVFCCMDTFGFL